MEGDDNIAVTSIWKIGSRLDHVIDYTTNVEKTKNSNSKLNYQDLHKTVEYIEDSYKTEEQLFVSGIHSTPEIAYEEMAITKGQFNKENGIQGYHAFQSFKEGEVTPEIAHEIGVKLAQEMWGDRFEVIVSTHINTNHIHNHFVINSVSFVDGKKYYDNRETYAELRRISDSLCEEYKLSVLKEKPCRNSRINYANYQQGNFQRINYYTIAKEDLNRAIAMAYSYKDFEELMIAMGYELTYRANKLSIRRDPYKKNIRIVRCFGEDYSIDKLTERIQNTHATRIPFIEEYNNKIHHIRKTKYSNHKKKGIYAIYLKYCYILKVFPKKYPYQKLPPSVRLDIKKLDDLSKEAELLVRNELKTNKQFFLYKETITTKLTTLMNMRSKLWKEHKQTKDTNSKNNIKMQIDELSKEIKEYRKEVELCEDIETRIPTISSNLKEVKEYEERKEVNKDELIR
ncbi:MAG: relaxase/mobilization nuclease domain-containing protein [bacterium]|nr:relaxase/mobilization nuclease domain-containing protein [bacterium]